jgi:N-acetyl sugar amidotransferase
MKVLVILTIEFPDPILDNELPHLSRAFDKVYILPQSARSNEVMGNVEVVSIFRTVDLKRPWRLLIANLLSLMRVFVYTLQYSERAKYVRHYRSFFGHFLNEVHKVPALKEFVLSKNLGDAIFYDYWMVDATIALGLLKRQGVIKRTVARVHGFDLYDERQFEGCVSFREYRVENLDAVFAISLHGYEYIRTRLPAHLKSRVHLSYLGVTDPGITLAQKKHSHADYLVVTCARLIALKRVALLADVLANTRLRVHWVHFGGGILKSELDEAITKLPQNVSVDLRGETNHDAVLAFYKEFHVDLFVSLSESEGIPVSMMEAISHGIPIFACRLNGIPEIVNDLTGTLIPLTAGKDEILDELEQTLLRRKFDRSAIYNFYLKRFNAAHNYNQFVSDIHELYNIQRHASMQQECARCVLSTADDPYITFDASGVCRYCLQYEMDEARLQREGKPSEQGLQALVSVIRKAGEGQKYDCLIGISGGVDSTYLAWLAKSVGLRPLAVHFDNGWNSELAVMNIENLVSRLGLDLHTLVVDWEEFRDLQLAFLKASVIDIELVTDHAMLATLYKLALQKNIKYILSGHNQVSEAVLPKNWYHDKRDHIHLKAIHKLFGTVPVKTFPRMNSWLKFRVEWKGITTVHLLDYIPYNTRDVKKFLVEELGWRDYGGKHYESVFTRFYQGYILPKKFGVDKRRAHLSNLICSGQITKAEAEEILLEPPYTDELQRNDQAFVTKKLKLSEGEFQGIMSLPVKKHSDYPVDVSIYERFYFLKIIAPFWRIFKTVRNAFSH